MHTQFLLEHTDGALLFMMQRIPWKNGVFFKGCKDFSGQNLTRFAQITMDHLEQNSVID